MNIYLVRHGESVEGSKDLYQTAGTPLSPKGIQESHEIAKKLSLINSDKNFKQIIVSDLIRAVNTAKIIKDKLDINLTIWPELREIKRPSEIILKERNSDTAIAIREKFLSELKDPNYKYSDEESYNEFRSRVLSVLNKLAKLEDDNYIVVTHSKVMKMTGTLIERGIDIDPVSYEIISKNYSIDCTNVCIISYKPGIDAKWEIIKWNSKNP